MRGYKPQVEDTERLIVKTRHEYGDGGYATKIELETAGAGDDEGAAVDDAD